jgi:hypothetical protein
MKRISVNGVLVHLLADGEVENLGVQHDIIYKDHGINLFFSGNRKELYDAAGMTITEFDWAVPEPWYDEQRKKDPNFNLYDYVWSYHKNKLFGEPLYLGGARRRVFELALKAAIDGAEEINEEWEL